MSKFQLIKEYHNNYVNYLISKIYDDGNAQKYKSAMVSALGLIESLEGDDVKLYLYYRYIKRYSHPKITSITGWSKSKQYNLKCKGVEQC